MPALNIELPDLSGADFADAKTVKALRDYMYVLTEQLSYTLSHLDADNLSDSVTNGISASAQKSEDALSGVEECRSSIKQTKDSISAEVSTALGDVRTRIEQNANAITLKASQSYVDDELGYIRQAAGNHNTSLAMAWASIDVNANAIASKVAKGSVISEINQSAEQVKIRADKIALEGMVTANGGFKIYDGVAQSPLTGQIPVSGWLEVTGGRVGCFLMADGGTKVEWGKTLQVGQMIMGYDRILSMNYAPSLKLSQSQLCMDSASRWNIINEDGTHVRADLGDGRGEQYLYAQPASLTGFYTNLPGVPANPGT